MTSDSPDLWTLGDLATPWSLHVVVTLRIAEQIEASGGTATIDALARATPAHAPSLHRVIRQLVERGVFTEDTAGVIGLNAPARALLDPGVRLGFDLRGIGGRMAGAWSTLLDAVQSGEPAYNHVFGRPFWDDLDAHPEVAASFDALMGPAGHGTPDADVLVDRDWAAVRTVVDVGGGTGALLVEILRAHPHVSGVLVDRPSTLARAFTFLEAAGVRSRVTLAAQSFFDPLPEGADLYVLKNVLADWPDRDAQVLLAQCARAARPNGRIAIVGGVAPDDAEGASPELLMLVLVGGRARTLSEFRELAARAGLSIAGTRAQTSGRFLVACRAMSGMTT
jgi:2,7-dihydroxy-5-methyl-1-naphthoate 7-O-methyltransferase